MRERAEATVTHLELEMARSMGVTLVRLSEDTDMSICSKETDRPTAPGMQCMWARARKHESDNSPCN